MENNILSTLTKEERKFLEVKTLIKGEFLFREGQLCTHVVIVVSGQIKISSMNYSGTEVVFNVLNKNEMFGNNLIFSDNPTYKGDVVSLKDSTIVLIKKENLEHILQSNKEFLLMYLNIQSNFGKKLNSTIKMLSFSSAEERFKFYLHENKGEIEYRTVTELADILHLKRETLSRVLTKLEKENVIQRSPHKIVKLD
jgi:CRP/FNR family transcriptional regulator